MYVTLKIQSAERERERERESTYHSYQVYNYDFGKQYIDVKRPCLPKGCFVFILFCTERFELDVSRLSY